MAKGFFTQGVVLLTDGRATIDDVGAALRDHGFSIVKEVAGQDEPAFGGPTLIVPFLPQDNGYLVVDVVNYPWPDAMGDPKTDPMTFGAWSMGHFGPLAFPGGLHRAEQHAWAWPEARTIAQGHVGFIRLRLSYVLGASRDTPVFPANYDPIEEIMFLSRVVLSLFKTRGVVCYFNPNGEVLRDEKSFREVWDPCTEQQFLPLPLWMNIRFFKLNESLDLMDTVGNGQLEVRDIEAIFPTNEYNPGDVDHYLRNVTQYLLGLDREMQSGEDIDGPGESNLSWTVEVHDEAISEPPRGVLRLYPKASRKAVRNALSAMGFGSDQRPNKRTS